MSDSETPPRLFTVNGKTVDQDKARQWAEFWQVKYSARYAQSGYRLARQRPKHSQELVVNATGGLNCRDTILALERQINGGQQLSEQGAPVLGLKP